MEFLFMGQWASTEAILILAIVGIFVGIFLYDGFLYLGRVFHIFSPKSIDTAPEVVGVFEVPSIKTTETPESEITESEPVKEEETHETPETITNDDIMEMNVGGDVDETLVQDTPSSTDESVLPDALVPSEVTEEVQQEKEDEPVIEETIEEIVAETPDEASEVVETPITENIVEPSIEPITTDETPLEEASEEPSLEEAKEEEVVTETSESTESTPSETTATKANNTEFLFALVNNVRTFIARGQTLEARGLIIQGLALDKNHRDLNMMLAGLYEQGRHFEKAEYIYKDLALEYPNDIEILEKLGNVLIIERRYEIALEMYKKILSLSGETEGTLYILTHLSHELGQHEASYEYSKKYQKRWPNNPEILTIIAQTEIALGKRQDAIQTLIKLKNLTPYNQEIADLIQKLVLEEELAGNFGEENEA